MLTGIALAACSTAVPPPTPPSPPAPAERREPSAGAIRYTVALPRAANQRAEVTLEAACPASGALDLWMARWTPGSYVRQDHARFVDGVAATGPAGARPTSKVAGDRWRVGCEAGEALSVRYDVVGRTWAVDANYVDAGIALLEGAATWLVPEGATGPFDVDVAGGPASAIASLPPRGERAFVADDVDALIDAVVVAGEVVERRFDVDGTPHALVFVGALGGMDVDRPAADAERLVRATKALWGGALPYPRYTWVVMVGDRSGGGLEHRDGSRIAVDRADPPSTVRRLLAHELFHAWNAERLRPADLVPVDYHAEQRTSALWVVEGWTRYYQAVTCARAGLLSEAEVLDQLGVASDATRARGAGRESLSEASLDAWTDLYQWDDDSPNRTVDYYEKGAIVAWLLDAWVRDATADRASLDDVLRALYARHRDDPYTFEDVRDVISEVAGRDAGPRLSGWVNGTEPLDFGVALHRFGLTWVDEGGGSPWLGPPPVALDGKLVFGEVPFDTPAAEAGIVPGDELVALGGTRVDGATLAGTLGVLGVGWRGPALVARRGAAIALPITLAAAPSRRVLAVDPGASPLAARRRAAWLAP